MNNSAEEVFALPPLISVLLRSFAQRRDELRNLTGLHIPQLIENQRALASTSTDSGHVAYRVSKRPYQTN
jgi:hypothetical protein